MKVFVYAQRVYVAIFAYKPLLTGCLVPVR